MWSVLIATDGIIGKKSRTKHLQEMECSMGIFYEMVELTNRSPIDLFVTFDGQAKRLKPGKNQVPAMVIQHAKNQNPIMGSHDPHNPHISGARYLVGVAADADEVEPLP